MMLEIVEMENKIDVVEKRLGSGKSWSNGKSYLQCSQRVCVVCVCFVCMFD